MDLKKELDSLVDINTETLPVPKAVIIKRGTRAYLARCKRFIDVHDPLDFKQYWGLNLDDFPELANETVYRVARLCFMLTDASDVKSWYQCWNHKTIRGQNFILNVNGQAREYHNNLFHQLKAECPDKKLRGNPEEHCELCKKQE